MHIWKTPTNLHRLEHCTCSSILNVFSKCLPTDDIWCSAYHAACRLFNSMDCGSTQDVLRNGCNTLCECVHAWKVDSNFDISLSTAEYTNAKTRIHYFLYCSVPVLCITAYHNIILILLFHIFTLHQLILRFKLKYFFSFLKKNAWIIFIFIFYLFLSLNFKFNWYSNLIFSHFIWLFPKLVLRTLTFSIHMS